MGFLSIVSYRLILNLIPRLPLSYSVAHYVNEKLGRSLGMSLRNLQ